MIFAGAYERSAHACIDAQVSEHDGYGRCISLDALWRAVGCPAGKSPRDWAELAAPLFPAFAQYNANLVRAHHPEMAVDPSDRVIGGDTTLYVEETGSPFVRPDDLMAEQVVAYLYAAHLEGPMTMMFPTSPPIDIGPIDLGGGE